MLIPNLKNSSSKKIISSEIKTTRKSFLMLLASSNKAGTKIPKNKASFMPAVVISRVRVCIHSKTIGIINAISTEKRISSIHQTILFVFMKNLN
jgi:hypothetical protein